MEVEIDVMDYLQYNSKLILTYFFVCLVALALNYLTHDKTNKLFFSTYKSSPFNPLTYIRLVGHIIGHSSWSHFSNNFVYILLVGPMLEEKFGTENLLLMMIITAVVVGIINSFRNHVRLEGASSIVFMFITLSSFVNLQDGKIPLTLILICLFHVVDEFLDLGKKDGVSHLGHIIGAICGCVFGFLYVGQQIQLWKIIQNFIMQAM